MMDAMDVDWCLTCNKQTTHGKPYCSKTCKMRAAEAADAVAGEFAYNSDDASSSSDVLRESFLANNLHHPRTSPRRHTHPSASAVCHDNASSRRSRVYHHAPQQQFLDDEIAALSRWPGYNDAGIRAWASAIPAGSASVETPSIGPSSACARPDFPLSRQRPAGPALCTDSTQPQRASVRSSSPISLPSPRAGDAQSYASYSRSSYSLVSALTESIHTPDSARPHTKARVHTGNGSGRPGVFEGIARRFRSWGSGTGAPPLLKHDAPAEIFMQTTTTTVPASPSPSSPTSPLQRSNTTKSNSKGSASGFTVRAEDEFKREPAVFDLRLPLAGARSPLAIGDAELKESLTLRVTGEQQKRGVWISGREKADKGWAGFGPAHYEKNYRPLVVFGDDECNDREREFREHEAWRARGRKPVRR